MKKANVSKSYEVRVFLPTVDLTQYLYIEDLFLSWGIWRYFQDRNV
jgi:hypothetical protein